MTDKEYTEPTNEQLARFLVVYARNVPGTDELMLSAPVLESLMSTNPRFREGALRAHRRFQEQIHEVSSKMELGELQCEHIRPNGKRCPNKNEPGIFHCGLHKGEYDEE